MYFLSSRIFSFFLSLLVFVFFCDSTIATESSTIQNIIKIKTYTSNSNGSFSFGSYGSAIAIGTSRILTNAHVILGSDDEPTGLYEVCFSTDFEKVPVCNETARLIAYDTVADLAILELSHTRSLKPFSLSSSKLAIGSYVSMYGYPGIGGETITRTEGKIAGFEQTMYKIDGSIDHGNSGGGAFNNSGELVGIPTAVASDNASIGYMIPVKRIQEFLAKKTNNYEIYTYKINESFFRFIQKNQSYHSNTSTFKWNNIIVRNPRRYGFVLNSSMVSSDDTMLSWSFSDSYDRVHFTISCTDDAGGITGWQSRLNGLASEKKLYPTWDILSTNEDDFFTVSSSSKGYKSGVVLYYKKYDACYVDIDYLDFRKDAKSLNKAINFLKKEVSFRQEYSLKNSHNNIYFKIENTPKDIRVIRSIDNLGIESVILGIEIVSGQWINGTIEGKEYPTLSDLGAVLGADFGEVKTWNDYIALGVKSGIEPSKIQNIILGSDQKGVLFSSFNNDKKTTSVVFEYTYKTQDNKYAYWTWSAVIKGDQSIDIDRIKKLFSGLIYPGKSFLVD